MPQQRRRRSARYPLLLLLLTAMPGCSTPRPFAVPYAPAPAPPTTSSDSIAIAPMEVLDGLPPLRRVTLPDSVRELRLSTGPGMILGAAYPLLRLVVTPTRVRGELLLYRCAQPTTGAPCRWRVRVARLPRPLDAAGLMARLDTLGIGTMRDAMPRTFTVMDAGELRVEERRGTTYRRFVLNAPTHRTDETGQRAAVMQRIVDSLAASVVE